MADKITILLCHNDNSSHIEYKTTQNFSDKLITETLTAFCAKNQEGAIAKDYEEFQHWGRGWIYIYIHINIYIYIYILIYIYISIYLFICLFIYVFIYLYDIPISEKQMNHRIGLGVFPYIGPNALGS